MDSIWTDGVTLPAFPTLQEDIQTDAAVIGGGMAGLLTAYFLQKRGLRAVVLEAGRIASGQTSGTTAKITSQHGPVSYTHLDVYKRQPLAQSEGIFHETSENCGSHYVSRAAGLYARPKPRAGRRAG